jgi:hypothetical protein
MQTENANWSAKLMAHRDWHDQETEALRRQLKQESNEKVSHVWLWLCSCRQ